MNDYTVAIEQQTQIVKKAEDAMRAALEAVTASKKTKNTAISDRVTSYKKQLEALESLIGSKAAELAEELIDVNNRLFAQGLSGLLFIDGLTAVRTDRLSLFQQYATLLTLHSFLFLPQSGHRITGFYHVVP